MRAWCANLRKIDLPESQTYDKSYDPSGWSAQNVQKPCIAEPPPPRTHGCDPSSGRSRSKKRQIREETIQKLCHPQYPFFKLPPIPPEKSYEKHSCFNETLLGHLEYHDHDARKYYRIFQNRFDLDIVGRFAPHNLCKDYPSAITRKYAFNWPECCIMAFTDTHIPIGIIMAHQTDSKRARITMFAVEHRVDENDVCTYKIAVSMKNKKLIWLEIQRLRKNGIRTVVLAPKDEDRKKQLAHMCRETGPLRQLNVQGEFHFDI
ncbi:unnamed protein product [Hydatigera taeniaeformis]|uniref:Tyrosine-protein phosphatase domain-containing protein n=1 Tax=Hydatigena taeniaeformis TaxID=6205 RepID=A0A0R3WLH1_HYDTA|nr:unnamed protein product [Hydatigera taeniaeformis]